MSLSLGKNIGSLSELEILEQNVFRFEHADLWVMIGHPDEEIQKELRNMREKECSSDGRLTYSTNIYHGPTLSK